MGKYYFHATTRNHLRNFNKTLGFALFFERHERQLRAWYLCKKLKITEQELDDIELGRGTLKLNLLKKLLNFYGKRIDLRLVTPAEDETDKAISGEFSDPLYDSFEDLEEMVEN